MNKGVRRIFQAVADFSTVLVGEYKGSCGAVRIPESLCFAKIFSKPTIYLFYYLKTKSILSVLSLPLKTQNKSSIKLN